jgi:hypothetical protein
MMLYAAGSVCDVSVRAEKLCGLTWSGQLLWFADAELEQVVCVDPYTAEVIRTISCPGLRCGLATMDGNLVYAAGADHQLVAVSPATGEQVAQARNPRPGQQVSAMEGARNGLWLGYRDMLDLRGTGGFELVTCLDVPGTVSGVAVTDRYVVYADRTEESITLVDPLLEQVILAINVHGSPTGLAWDGAHIWYCDSAANRLRAIDVPGLVRSL